MQIYIHTYVLFQSDPLTFFCPHLDDLLLVVGHDEVLLLLLLLDLLLRLRLLLLLLGAEAPALLGRAGRGAGVVVAEPGGEIEALNYNFYIRIAAMVPPQNLLYNYNLFWGRERGLNDRLRQVCWRCGWPLHLRFN